MKKIVILLLSLFFVFIGCSREEEKEPGIGVDRCVAYSYYYPDIPIIKELNTNLSFSYGIKNDTLWVKGFEKEPTKDEKEIGKQIFDWTEKTNLDTSFIKYEGYGVYVKYKYIESKCGYFYKFNNLYSFVLFNYYLGEVDNNCSVFANLYFIDTDANKVKKHKTILNYNKIISTSIHPWFEGIIATINDKSIYYNMNGDSLFVVNRIINNKYDEALSAEESIRYNLNLSNKTISLSKLNIKTNEYSWVTDTLTIDKSQEKIKISSIDIEKLENNWIYTISYIRYNGDKKSIQIDLNVNTGEVELK